MSYIEVVRISNLSRQRRLFVEIGLILVSILLCTVKLSFYKVTIKFVQSNSNNSNVWQLTARSSSGVNIFSNCFLTGIIIMRKNGKSSETLDDLTVQSITSAATWTNVKMCIFHVGTRRTNGSVPWCLTGMKKRRNLLNKVQLKVWTSFTLSTL